VNSLSTAPLLHAIPRPFVVPKSTVAKVSVVFILNSRRTGIVSWRLESLISAHMLVPNDANFTPLERPNDIASR
jgi:hypothetical protein